MIITAILIVIIIAVLTGLASIHTHLNLNTILQKMTTIMHISQRLSMNTTNTVNLVSITSLSSNALKNSHLQRKTNSKI